MKNIKKVGSKILKGLLILVASIIALVIVITVIGFNVQDNETESEESKQETVANDSSEDKQEAKEEEKNGTKQEEAEPVVEEEPVEEPSTDEDELKEALDEEVVASDVKGVEFGTGASDVTIELDGKSALSNKSTTRGFKMGTAEALLALKKSGIDVNSADIYVYSELTDGTEEREQMVMSSRWDRATIDSMDEDALYTLPDHIETKAESSFMHPIMRK